MRQTIGHARHAPIVKAATGEEATGTPRSRPSIRHPNRFGGGCFTVGCGRSPHWAIRGCCWMIRV